ncbi:hypothetical protein DFH07DRAFT_775806 [Mycena maculata]|uniref:Uncharacterized protein n=1 Tax=Mycena maculata TaxID=230809 RepID=A0AAD7N6U3_9AGAR|nr:hypothetical protein DFH07DRAFT_775806 [Mycena maculata]
MAEIAPPPYVGSNVADHVDTKVTSSETEKVQQLSAELKSEATAILEDPSNKKLIQDSIETLCSQTLAARKAFEYISILLETFDARHFKTKGNKVIEPLRPAWETLRERYNALLDNSKSDAVAIKATCDDYKANVLSLLKENLSLKMKALKDEICEFQTRTEQAAKAAQGKSDSFDALRFDVKQCKAKIEAAFTDAAADPTGWGPTLQREIEELQQRIGEAQKYIEDCMLALKEAEGVTGVAEVLFGFLPFAATLVADATSASVNTENAANKQRELDGYRTSLAITQNKLAAVVEREQILAQLRTQLQLLNDMSNFTTIMNQLAALSTFWKATSGDLTSLTVHLETAYSDDTSIRTVKTTLGDELAGHIYLTLSEVLGKYISQMSMLDRSANPDFGRRHSWLEMSSGGVSIEFPDPAFHLPPRHFPTGPALHRHLYHFYLQVSNMVILSLK